MQVFSLLIAVCWSATFVSNNEDPSQNPDAVAIALDETVKPVVLVQKNELVTSPPTGTMATGVSTVVATKNAKLRPISNNPDDLFVSDDDEEQPVILASSNTKKQLVIKTPAPKTRLVDKVESPLVPRKPHIETQPIIIQKPVKPVESQPVIIKKATLKPVESQPVIFHKAATPVAKPPNMLRQKPVVVQVKQQVETKPFLVQATGKLVDKVSHDQALLNALSAPVLMPMARGHPVSPLFNNQQIPATYHHRSSMVPMDEVYGAGVDAVYREPVVLSSRLRGGNARFAYKHL